MLHYFICISYIVLKEVSMLTLKSILALSGYVFFWILLASFAYWLFERREY